MRQGLKGVDRRLAARLEVAEHSLAAVPEPNAHGDGTSWSPAGRDHGHALGEVDTGWQGALHHALWWVREALREQGENRAGSD